MGKDGLNAPVKLALGTIMTFLISSRRFWRALLARMPFVSCVPVQLVSLHMFSAV